MASKTITFTQSMSIGSFIVGKIEWSYTSSPSTNKSTISTKISVKKGNATTTLTEPTTGTWTYVITIDGQKVYGTPNKSVLTDWVLLGTHTTEVSHNTDGSKSLTISGYIDAPDDTNYENHRTAGAGTYALEPISRATTIDSLTCSSSYLNGIITAEYTPKSSDLYNRRRVYVNVNGTIKEITTKKLDIGKKAAGLQESKIEFSASELSTIYSTIPDATKAKIRVTFQTFSNSGYTVQIGSDQYREINLSVPTTTAPTVSLKVTPINNNSWIANKNIYAAGLSGAKVVLSASPNGGADISSTSIVYNGTQYDVEQLNIETINNSGSIEFIGKATDTRGRSASTTNTITVLPYSPPIVTSMQVDRGTYNNGWTEDEDGQDVRVVFKTTVALASKGNVYRVAFKLDGDDKDPIAGTTAGIGSGIGATVYFTGLDNEASHKLTLIATDSVGYSGTATITVQTTHVTVEYRANGKGIAFGKTSEKDAFECAWPAHFNDAVYITDKITCPNDYSLRNFNINCNWADHKAHDMIVRENDGLTVGLGWTGNAEDGTSYDTVLDVRPKQANFRGTVKAPRGRFTATTDLAGDAQNEVALRIGVESGDHIDIDDNEIQAKSDATTPSTLNLNAAGGDVYAKGFRIPEIQRGSAKITPSAANTPTSLEITFEKAFSGTPTVIVTPYTAVPGTTVLGVGVNGASKTGCTIWVTRTNTTETAVHWIAIY